MGQLQDYFYVTISKDRMAAEINYTEAYNKNDINIDEQGLYNFLHNNRVMFGIDKSSIKSLLNYISIRNFPLRIAKGIRPKNGVDGTVHYELDFSTEIDRTLDKSFRDVMRIPSVNKYQRLATVLLPTDGKNGTDVLGNTVQARPGKPVAMKAGKNVVYKVENHSFYSVEEGQPSTRGWYIEVHPTFELNNTLSMKTGNIDFVGSVTINGDVPTGYIVKAVGDIKVFGIVEAATIIAGGSVFVSEGLSGLQRGHITAKGNVHIGYINQGIVNAGGSLYVENSIIHSQCEVKGSVFCKRGNIIGGTLSAGLSIEAKDVGNRLNTATEITLKNIKKSSNDKIRKLKIKKEELEQTLTKLALLGEKLADTLNNQNIQAKITLLRQKNSYEKTSKKLAKITDELNQQIIKLDKDMESKLIVRNYIYPNITVSFGRYRRITKQTHHYVQVKLARNEIFVSTLK